MDVLSTRQVAELLAVSEATVKRWADAGTLHCFRTPGGHRKFRMADVSDFLRTHQYETAGPVDALPQPASGGDRSPPSSGGSDGLGGTRAGAHDATPPDRAEAAVTFRNLALAGDVDGLVSHIAQRRLLGQTLASVFDHVASPALVDVGERWARGVLTVTQEHIASGAVVEALARTRPLIERPANADRGRALLACPGEEQHDIALRMASLLAHGLGFVTRLVGPRAPAADFALVVTAERPRVVVLSATECVGPAALRQELHAVAEASRAVGAHLVLGGRGFERLDALPHGALHIGSLTDFARVLSGAAAG